MKYKLIGSNDYDNPLHTFLENRGIEDIDGYINLNEDVLIPYQNLANIDKAVDMYKKHIEQNHNITILTDCDVDGYTSAAMIYSYTRTMNPECKLTYLLHDGKGHGLTDEIIIPEDTDLLIIPDAATNDVEQCKSLRDKGVDILILDHHEREKNNDYAVIINNQCCDYANKFFSGAGIVYKFIQACDDELWSEEADNYIDLVALAQISDNMDMREPETKYITLLGLEAIHNKLFEALIEAQSYSLPDGVDIIGVQFYITPIINALIRVGTQQEKDLLFRAFIEDESETFEYKKRGDSEYTQENIYERVTRLCKNAKSKQTRILEKQMPEIIEHIQRKGQDKHEVIVTNVTDYLDSCMTGYVAIKIADNFHKPCILLRNKDNGIYAGSVRVPDTNPISNFKDCLNTLGVCIKAQGHASAFGVEFEGKAINDALNILDNYITKNQLQDIGEIKIDFEIDYAEFGIGIFNDIARLKPYYGCCLRECNVVIKNIPINADDIVVQGKNQDTWCTMICDDAIKLIKFKCPDDDIFLNAEGDYVINIIGKLGYNYYNGVKTAQIIVNDYEVV